MTQLVEKAHSLVDGFQEFANSHVLGYCKHWKAVAILVTVAQNTDQFQGENLVVYVESCLIPEGFTAADCVNIAAWIERNLLANVEV